MKYDDVDVFRCPVCRQALVLSPEHVHDTMSQEITDGWLMCKSCCRRYQIIKSIPRFVDSEKYASSFGYQWRRCARTQIGGEQKKISKVRFDVTTKWPDNLEGQLILEAGCGAGRFSEIALETGAEVYSFDITAAVESALESISSEDLKRRYHPFQADIYTIPLAHNMFDKIFCMGVLQSCPHPKKAFLSLVPFLKPGGELVIDCYLKQPLKDAFNMKYLLRPFFRWWRPSWLFGFCSIAVSVAYDVKSLIVKLPLVGAWLSNLIPIGRLHYEPEYHFTIQELKEIKTLSMFDMLSPKYDKPQRLEDVREWIEEAGLELLELGTGYNGINARSRKSHEVSITI